MSRPKLPFAVVLIAATCAVGSFASAPADQYATFDASSPTITDRKTGLTWQRTASPVQPSLAAARGYCAGLGKWRLPTVKELLTLVDEKSHDEVQGGVAVHRYIDSNAFPSSPGGPFAAETPVIVGNKIWVVDFSTGDADRAADGQVYARCVAY